MFWDYRVIRRLCGNSSLYQIHRVFYRDNSRLVPDLIETSPTPIVGASAINILKEVEAITNAFDSPTIYVPEIS